MQTFNPPLPTLGKYEIRGVLGRGGMGTVYDCWDPIIGRRVAIKTVRILDHDDAEAAEGLARFKREAQAAGRLSHPNIVGVHDYGETGEVAFIVMEFVQGHSLKQRMDAHERFPVRETVRIMEQVLAALQFSHDRQVIHRDIKPGNVMMTEDGQAKLADFGIARIESSVMTQSGTMLGTPAYMSPEQLMAQEVDARSDLYSAGVMLYQMLTGERPFEGGLTAIIHKALNTTPPMPSEISVTAPTSLDTVVARAMARRPADRYSSAAAFSRAMREAFEAAGTGLPGIAAGAEDDATRIIPRSDATAKSRITPPPPVRRQNKALLGGVAAIALLALGGGTWLTLRPSAPKPAAPVPPSMTTVPAVPAQPATSGDPSPTKSVESPTPPATPKEEASAIVPLPVVPPPAPTALRDALSALAHSADCALPSFSVSYEGRINVSGLIGTGEPAAMLRKAVEAAAPGASVIWDLHGVQGPYCEVFNLVRPLDLANPFLGLALKDDNTHLREHDLVLPQLKLPEFAAYLQVDYFSHDGSVAHLFPIRGLPNMPFAANAKVSLGTSVKDRVEVGPPFGTDVIVAIASAVPLFPPGRVRDDETTKTYLPALQVALDAARKKNVKLTGRALVLETEER
jgi:serine/threonine protein kinase